jgi:large subunit ribosomal protein L18
MNKKEARLKRALKLRCKIKSLDVNRLTVHKSSQHIYAQILSKDGSKTIASVSTVEASVKSALDNTGNVFAAALVGKLIAEKAVSVGVEEVAFDRSGFKYHGRIKALADAARDNGLKF